MLTDCSLCGILPHAGIHRHGAFLCHFPLQNGRKCVTILITEVGAVVCQQKRRNIIQGLI